MKKDLNMLQRFGIRFTVIVGAILLTIYLGYRLTFINFSPWLAVFSMLLFVAELHTIFHTYGLFYALWPRNYTRYSTIYNNKSLQFNIFICVCGEPTELIKQTIFAAKRAQAYYARVIDPYSLPKIYVLNDGKVANKDNWQEIEKITKEAGVTHIIRDVPGGFKAGNINNGLALTPSIRPFDTLDIVLDADFAVKEHFLVEIAKPFVDQTIDFVQSPQRYKNEHTWVAKAAAAHQIFFFDYICPAKGHDNALFLCGTNFAIRRSALNSVGGMDTRFITEDYSTSLELHLQGKKGVFMPEVLAEGVAPSSLKAYYSQQRRWSKGSMDVSLTYLRRILFGPLTARQKFHYLLSATYYLVGMRDLIFMLAPLPYLLFGVSLIKANTWQYLVLIYTPLFVYNFVLYLTLFRNPIKSLVLDLASFPVFVAAFLSSITKKELSFIVTIKKYERENPFVVYRVQLFVSVLIAIALAVGLRRDITNIGVFLNYFWASFDLLFLTVGFYLITRENYDFSNWEAKIAKLGKQLLFTPRYRSNFITRAFTVVALLSLSIYSISKFPPIKTLAIPISSRVTSTPTPTPKVSALVPQNGIYYGYYQPNLNNHPQNPIFENVVQEKSSLTMFYQDWSDDTFDTDYAKRISKSGHIPVITWEPWDSSKNTPPSIIQSDYTLQTIIDGNHDAFIRQWAKDAANYGQPVFLRFAHEMNGDWYPWGNMNKPATYIAAWQHVHNIFVAEGATNVLWVWSPNNTDQDGSITNLLYYYPGDNYVDWIGFSAFNWGTSSKATKWRSFKQISGDTYTKLASLNKPIIVAETASSSAGGNKELWYSQMITKDLPKMPQIKGIIFFNEDIKGVDFSLRSGLNYEKLAKKSILQNPYFYSYPVLKTL